MREQGRLVSIDLLRIALTFVVVLVVVLALAGEEW